MHSISIKFYLIIILLFISSSAGAQSVFQNEALQYTISYKWGLIHKDAGEATLKLKREGDLYNITLSAKTKSWADHIYQVRDTLKATLKVQGLKPQYYAKITHEKGEYKFDDISYSYQGETVTGKARRIRYKKGVPSLTEKTFTSTGPVYDMLSIFYYLRKLDFQKMNSNTVYTATIFSGKQKETIKIRNLGIEKIKLRNKKEVQAYKVRFNFTRDGGKKSGEDMETWISTDSRHIPLYLVAKLPIGEVRAYYTGS